MSGLGSWLWGASQLDEAVDKATSELLPSGQEDIALNLEICDQIRSKSAPAKDAMRALKRRLNHKNPNVQLLALSLTDICIKNGGDHFLTEVASREFVDNLVSILKVSNINIDVRKSILRHIQNWSVAFEGKSNLKYVGHVYKQLKSEGFDFPPQDSALVSSAMVDTQTAPEWIDSDVCLRCRTAFTFTNRKHHCRNCGQVFDHACTTKSMPLPHFGITQEVRVCDGCYTKLHRSTDRRERDNHRAFSPNSVKGSHRNNAQLLADAELQRAIELSLQEVGMANKQFNPSNSRSEVWEPPIVNRSTHPANSTDEDDPELRAAIEASLRESNAPKASAPFPVEPPTSEGYGGYYNPTLAQPEFQQQQQHVPAPIIPSNDLDSLEEDAILTFSQTVDQLQTQGGRDLTQYPGMVDLHRKADSLRPKLAYNLDELGRKDQLLSEMHQSLSEAVKLYDKILTHQVSQPRWQAAPQRMQTSYAPPTQTQVHAPIRQQSLSMHAPYGAVEAPALPTSPPIHSHHAPAQAPHMQRQNSFQATSSPPHTLVAHMSQPQQMQLSHQFTPSGATGYAAVANPMSPPPTTIPLEANYTGSYLQSAATPAPVSSVLQATPHVPHMPVSPPPMPAFTPTPQPQQPTTLPQQPARQPTQYNAQPTTRSVSAVPPPATLSLNQFPSAPTAVPQPHPPIHQPERKEALLIDL